MEDAGFYLIPPTEEIWAEYENLCQEQLGYRPRRTDKAIFVSQDSFEGSLMAGLTLVNTDGPYVFVDGYVVSPALDPKGKYNATVFCQHELKRACNILNRGAVALVSHKGLQAVLGNNGFQRSNSSLWVYIPTGISRSPEYVPVKGKNVEPTHVEPTYVEPPPAGPGPTEAPRKRGWPKGKPRGPRKRAQTDPQ